MSEETKPAEPTVESKPTTIERIRLLANLAYGVENEQVKNAMLALNDGDKLYALFAEAVAKEMESVVNPSQAAPKELVDTITLIQSLKSHISYLYQAVGELNNARLIGVLAMLNTNLGGNHVGSPPNQQGMEAIPQAARPTPPPQNTQGSPAPAVTRSNNTGMSW